MLLLAVSPTLGAAYPFAIFVGATNVTLTVSATALMQLRASDAMRGRVLSLQTMVLLGSTPIGGPLIGWVCDVTGPRVGILIGAVAAAVASGGGYLVYRRHRDVEGMVGQHRGGLDGPPPTVGLEGI
jgi:hypothetical protein